MAQTTRQQIQTMFDLIETLKERKYLPGESKISDDRITDALRTMVEPNGLMDATIAKVLRRDMSGEEFKRSPCWTRRRRTDCSTRIAPS